MNAFLKTLPLLLALVLTLSACAADPAAATTTEEEQLPILDVTTAAPTQDNGGNENTPSTQASLKSIYDAMMKSVKAEMPSLVETPVNRDNFEYYFGISDRSVADSTFVSEPMMGAIPFGIAMMRVKAGQDAAAIAAQMKQGVDPRRWVCVTASYVETAVKGDLIILVLDDDATRGAQIIEAFNKQ